MTKDQLSVFIDFIGKGLTLIAYILGGGAIIRFRHDIYDTFPEVAWPVGLFVILSGLYLFWLLAMHAIEQMADGFQSKRKGAIYGFFLMAVAFPFLYATLTAGTNS